jgi:DNA-binding transcriptional MerR regulator
MRIGRLAKLTGRSVHTIRWYESQRLIPGVRRDAQGRRVYVEAHVGWLDLLDRLRTSGMKIRELREYTSMAKRGATNIEECIALLRAHRRRIEASMTSLHTALQIVDAKIGFYDEWRTTGVRPPSDHQRRPDS